MRIFPLFSLFFVVNAYAAGSVDFCNKSFEFNKQIIPIQITEGGTNYKVVESLEGTPPAWAWHSPEKKQGEFHLLLSQKNNVPYTFKISRDNSRRITKITIHPDKEKLKKLTEKGETFASNYIDNGEIQLSYFEDGRCNVEKITFQKAIVQNCKSDKCKKLETENPFNKKVCDYIYQGIIAPLSSEKIKSIHEEMRTENPEIWQFHFASRDQLLSKLENLKSSDLESSNELSDFCSAKYAEFFRKTDPSFESIFESSYPAIYNMSEKMRVFYEPNKHVTGVSRNRPQFKDHRLSTMCKRVLVEFKSRCMFDGYNEEFLKNYKSKNEPPTPRAKKKLGSP